MYEGKAPELAATKAARMPLSSSTLMSISPSTLEVLGMNSRGLIHALEETFHPPTLHLTIQCKRLCTDPVNVVSLSGSLNIWKET